MSFVLVIVIIESIQLWKPMKCIRRKFYKTLVESLERVHNGRLLGKYYQLDMENIKEQGENKQNSRILTQIALQVTLSPHFTFKHTKIGNCSLLQMFKSRKTLQTSHSQLRLKEKALVLHQKIDDYKVTYCYCVLSTYYFSSITLPSLLTSSLTQVATLPGSMLSPISKTKNLTPVAQLGRYLSLYRKCQSWI